MTELLGALSLEQILLGNAVVAAIAAIFVSSARPVRLEVLRRSFLWFWGLLANYYFVRALFETLELQYRQVRIRHFLADAAETTPVLAPPGGFEWLLLVVLADLPIAALVTGYCWMRWQSRWARIRALAVISVAFLLLWFHASTLGTNWLSALLAFCVLCYVGWRLRLISISSSMLWLTYGFLNLPFRAFTLIGHDAAQLLFVLLLVSKVSLIPATYKAIGVEEQ